MKPLVKTYLCNSDSEKFFGFGPYLLLKETEKTGSLRKAATSMDMAYTKALKLIKTAEINLNFKLIETTTGGKGGGGSILTKEATELILNYEQFKREIDEYTQIRFRELFK